jgi:transcription elongation factor Elf1
MPLYYPLEGFEARAYIKLDMKANPPLYRWRCPACNSEKVSINSATIDEKITHAIKPQDVVERKKGQEYRYQEYRYLTCQKCQLTWQFEPTARWSTIPDRLTSEPYDPRPTRLTDEKSGSIIREHADFSRARWQIKGQFSSSEISGDIIHSPVMILTGAGASVPLGFPTSTGFSLTESERRGQVIYFPISGSLYFIPCSGYGSPSWESFHEK